MDDSTRLFLFLGYSAAFVSLLAYVLRLTLMFRRLESEAHRLSESLSDRGTM